MFFLSKVLDINKNLLSTCLFVNHVSCFLLYSAADCGFITLLLIKIEDHQGVWLSGISV